MKPEAKRPLFVTLLAGGVFSLSAASFSGLIVGLARWQFLADRDLSVPLWLLLAWGGLWGAVWLAMAWGLWRLLSWARQGTIICWIVYQVMEIGRQVLFVQGDYERGRLSFAIGMGILLTILLTAGLMSPRVRQAFGRD